MRLFVAVWPPPELAGRLAALARPDAREVRWTPAHRLHVTLRFLGEVPDPGPVVRAVSARAGTGRAEAALGPATTWLPGRQVLVVPVGGLGALAAAVGDALAGHGGEQRPWLGHLTLARVRGRRRGRSELAGTPFEAAWPVEELTVVASVTASSGPEYRVLARVPL